MDAVILSVCEEGVIHDYHSAACLDKSAFVARCTVHYLAVVEISPPGNFDILPIAVFRHRIAPLGLSAVLIFIQRGEDNWVHARSKRGKHGAAIDKQGRSP